MEAVEEIERENALQFMLLVYLGEKRWAKMSRAGLSFAESADAAPRGPGSGGRRIGIERRRLR
jgi:hypothetical protein